MPRTLSGCHGAGKRELQYFGAHEDLVRGRVLLADQVVRDAAVLSPGDAVTARFARGEADCEVLRTRADLTGAEVAP